jgi:hypothetical protein
MCFLINSRAWGWSVGRCVACCVSCGVACCLDTKPLVLEVIPESPIHQSIERDDSEEAYKPISQKGVSSLNAPGKCSVGDLTTAAGGVRSR